MKRVLGLLLAAITMAGCGGSAAPAASSAAASSAGKPAASTAPTAAKPAASTAAAAKPAAGGTTIKIAYSQVAAAFAQLWAADDGGYLYAKLDDPALLDDTYKTALAGWAAYPLPQDAQFKNVMDLSPDAKVKAHKPSDFYDDSFLKQLDSFVKGLYPQGVPSL